MKAIDRHFTKIINGTTQFVIPVFQRDYSWTEAQCDQLWWRRRTNPITDSGRIRSRVPVIPITDSGHSDR